MVEPFASNRVEIYPDPADSKVTLTLDDSQIGHNVEVTDLSGRVIGKATTNDRTLVFDCDEFTNATYVCSVNEGTSSFTGKFTMEH